MLLRLLSILLLAPSTALAFRPLDDRAETIELKSGEVARPHIDVEHRTLQRHPAWEHFLENAGGSWRSMWDRNTGVPVRIWGSGIAAPNSDRSPKAAEQFARTFLAQHLALLAPGANVQSFELVSNVHSQGVRSLGFRQLVDGVPVAQGQVSLRFKNDRLIAIGSEAFPNLSLEIHPSRFASEQLVQEALQWTAGRFEKIGDPIVRAVVLADGSIRAAHVAPVIVWTRDPIGRWEVDVDLGTGKVFARRQTLMFASGSIKYRVPVRHPGGPYREVGAGMVDLTIDGARARSTHDGNITWTSSTTARVSTSVVGPLVYVTNEAGATASTTLSLSDTGTAVWDESDDELRDAQLTSYIASKIVRDYMKNIAPDLGFLEEQLPVFVNIDDTCNAFSDGTSINFLRRSADCENTARLVDVVMHEYGHSVHAHAIIPGVGDFEGGLSEGGADYLAATVANDPGMGRGFFHTDDPLRHIDPEGSEAVWPRDRGESHTTGLIFAGAMWDLRKQLIEKYGYDDGVMRADRLFYGAFQRASSIPTTYVEVLAGDDDDGDLSNGTPNICGITDVFRAHGLANATEAGLSIGTVGLNEWRVQLPVVERGLCPGFEVASATMVWDLRSARGTGATLEMTKNAELGVFEASIPPQLEGEVLLYNVSLTLANGEVLLFPDNPADPMYETFIGQTTPIYCTGFETEPLTDGWEHEMIFGSGRRARDEWEWGRILSDPGSGDPIAAYAGEQAIGNDLGHDQFSVGTYQRNKIEEMRSPAIDVRGHQKVRLQYRRWLTIEDGDFDQAEILIGDNQMWSNLASGMGELHHLDREWRFHDVDITDVADANSGVVQLTYRLTSDDGLQLGGWTIDEFCLVGWDGPTARCGDGKVDAGEACDDGNANDGDGCEATCINTPAPVCGNGSLEAGEQCDDGNAVSGDGCESSCLPSEDPLKTVDDKGCACTSTSRSATHGSLSLILLLGLLLARRKR